MLVSHVRFKTHDKLSLFVVSLGNELCVKFPELDGKDSIYVGKADFPKLARTIYLRITGDNILQAKGNEVVFPFETCEKIENILSAMLD